MMQIVYISNRPTLLSDTLSAVSQNMPFITQALAVIPQSMLDEFTSIKSPIPLQFIFDESLGNVDRYRSDHQSLNYYLRMSLSEHAEIDDEFIMSDDDARPIKYLEPTFFKEGGKYHSYYFYDMSLWNHGVNSFDIGQRNTHQVLKHNDYPSLSFASHMPQIFNKVILHETKHRFQEFSKSLSLCEWGTYFNFAHREHAEQFHTSQPYQTLCWPDCVTCWPQYVEPPSFSFENYSPHLYQPGNPFYKLDSLFDQDMNIGFKKQLVWHRHQIAVLQGARSEHRSFLKNLAHKTVVRPLQRLKELISCDERNELRRLTNRVRLLEDRKNNRL